MLVQRFHCGPNGEIVTIGASDYHFQQAAPGEPYLCEVTDVAHLARLAEIPEGYKLYDVATFAENGTVTWTPVSPPELEDALEPVIPEEIFVPTVIAEDDGAPEIVSAPLPEANNAGGRPRKQE